MMLPARVDRLEAGRAGADVDPLDEPVLAQLLEHAVDAGNPDAAVFRAQLIEDLLGGQAAILASQQLDDRAAGAAFSVPLRVQGSDRRLGPGAHLGWSGHVTNGSASRLQLVAGMSIVSLWRTREGSWLPRCSRRW